ncbi:MAG: hypothetical protein EBR82_86875 [Caulobacteraceae bacterium]|nr:hypothetical protein [Caulobacteraceae bacterium]
MNNEQQQYNAKMAESLKKIANDLKPVVQEVEAQPATTKNRYDQYLYILGVLSKKYADTWPVAGPFFKDALIMAGANKQGVNDAYNLL